MKHDNTEPKWWLEGLVFGFFMFIIVVILLPLIYGEDLVLKKVLIGVPASLIAGLGYGLIMHIIKLKFYKK